MKAIVDKASSRELKEQAGIKTYQTFNPSSPVSDNFGALRILNDYWIAPDEGFASHLNKNLDIITIPTKGKIKHNDSERNSCVIEPKMVQIMSAGKGICHSEFNISESEPSEMIKLGISPSIKDTRPWYDTFNLSKQLIPNGNTFIISPIEDEAPLSINQDAWISIGKYEKGTTYRYRIHDDYLGIYIFIIHGEVKMHNHKLSEKDGIRIMDTRISELNVLEDTELLTIEVPLHWH